MALKTDLVRDKSFRHRPGDEKIAWLGLYQWLIAHKSKSGELDYRKRGRISAARRHRKCELMK